LGLPLGVAAAMLADAGIRAPVNVADVCENLSGGVCCARSS